MTHMLVRGASGRLLVIVATLAIANGSGCQSYFASAWKDELAGRPEVDSPSMVRLRGLEGQPSALHREGAEKHVTLAATTVEHAPLYYEDPFEAPSCDDGMFRWTLMDIGATFYCGGRWLVNSVAVPVSVVVDPPCATAITDASQPGPTQRAGCAKSCCGMSCGRSGCCANAPAATKPEVANSGSSGDATNTAQ